MRSVARATGGAGVSASHLRIDGLTKRFGPHRVLESISFDLRTGEVAALLGANGVGKTTTLNCLAGLARIDGGRILMRGAPFDRRDPGHRSRIGVVSHDTFLYSELTVRENLLLHARIHRLPDARVDEVMAELELRRFGDTRIGHLSRGWRQRSGVARAILHRPELLLLDEPFSGLDLRATRLLRELLARLKNADRSILLTTHDLGATRELADRVIVLDRRSIAFDGPTAELSAADLDALLAGPPRAEAAPS